MKTKEDLEKELAEVNSSIDKLCLKVKRKRAKVDEIQCQLEEISKVPVRWRAEVGEVYWFIEYNGKVKPCTEKLDRTDQETYDTLNYFESKEEAERIAKVQLAYRKLDCAMSGMEKTNSVSSFIVCINERDEFIVNVNVWFYNPLPRLKNREDCEYLINTYPTELRTFLTGGRE